MQTKAGVEMEYASRTRFALHPNTAAHGFDQAGRDGETEPGPSEFPGHRTVGLRETFEDGFLFLQRNAHPSVGDREMQRGFCFRLFYSLNAEHNLAFRRELHRIAHQIQHDLAQARRISQQSLRHVGKNVIHQLEPFLVSADTDRFQGVIQVIAAG